MAVIVGQGISVSPVADAELSHESTSTVQNKVVTDAIASEYSTSKTYSVGDVCTHDGKLYECIVDIPTAEGWTLSHWKVSNLGDNVSNLNRQLSDVDDTKAPVILETASGAIASFDDGADSMPIRKLVAQIELVQAGTGDPSHDNVRPISGWTGCAISHSGADTTDPDTLTINWQAEAGTVYGGTLTLNQDRSADLVSKWRYYDGGDITWQKDATSYKYGTFYATGDFYVGSNYNIINVISSQYTGVSNNGATESGDNYCWIRHLSSSNRQLQVKDTSKANMSASEFKQAMTGVGFLVRMLTPATYHFDNIGQLKTFLGTNNVWCDTGDITELTYPADTKLFLTARDEEITGNIAPIENGTTASQAYAQGAYFWHDTKFCKALTAIASGATFTLGTNYQETTVAAELLAAQN